MIGLGSEIEVAPVLTALALQILVGALLLRAGSALRPRVAMVGIAMFLVSVALLRDGVRPTPGYAPLLVLPMVWAALRGRRDELVLAIAGAAGVLFLPIVMIGGAQYPVSGWRSGALIVGIAAVVGIAVLELVDRLRTSEERHRLLAENSTDMIARFALDATITYASPASRMLLGYEPDELVGRNLAEFTKPDHTAKRPERVARVDSAPDTVTLESQLRHRDGRWLWVESTVRAIRDADGTVIERQAAIRPIEERKRLQLTVERQRDEANEMLASQHALRQIATLVATGAEPGAVFGAVAEQIASLLGGTLGAVVRFDGPAGVGEIVGSWSAYGTRATAETIDLAGDTATARVYQTGAPAEVVEYGPAVDEPLRGRFELSAAVGAPIVVGGRLWGSAGAAFAAGAKLPAGAEERIARFAELVAAAIANAQARENLAHQAATDAVTGLANHRAFHERLRAEVERASRHGRALSIAVFDLDHFKQVNDTYGHLTGDAVLAAVARRVAAVARTGELVARIGGEEFAWLMPETTQAGAYLAADRARRAVEATPFEGAGRVTISAGVCSNRHAATAHELVNAADGALYRAKRGGRNATFVYAADTAPDIAYAG
jgi:diguanylate cyclase (GGDEF)-like protein/PAS domain S-box-containing protein